MPSVTFTLNGQTRAVDAEGDIPLLWVLRDQLRLTGTKYGCGIAQCGACTVLMDGTPSRACVTPFESVAGTAITTVEGMRGRIGEAVRESWRELDVAQCGYCQSGQMLAAVALLAENAAPTDPDIDGAMAGNICRCATYVRIRSGIHLAARKIAVEAL